jgi:hypothetical protein
VGPQKERRFTFIVDLFLFTKTGEKFIPSGVEGSPKWDHKKREDLHLL